jgi:hypothetical protein
MTYSGSSLGFLPGKALSNQVNCQHYEHQDESSGPGQLDLILKWHGGEVINQDG